MIYQAYEPLSRPIVDSQPLPEPAKKPIRNHINLFVIGDAGVGKHSLVKCFNDQVFSGKYDPQSQEHEVTGKVVLTGANIEKEVDLRVTVYAHLRRFANDIDAPYRSAHAILIVCDSTDRPSFDNVRVWKQEVERYAPEKVPCFLTSTRCDLTTKKVVETNQLVDRARELGVVAVAELSAKDDQQGVKKFFHTIANNTPEAKKIVQLAVSELASQKPPQNPPPPDPGCSIL